MCSNDPGGGETIQDFEPATKSRQTILAANGALDTVAGSALRTLGAVVEVSTKNDHAQAFGTSLPLSCPLLALLMWLVCKVFMTSPAQEYIRFTSVTLDRLLSLLTKDEQHDLLDALAAEGEERLDMLIERTDA